MTTQTQTSYEVMQGKSTHIKSWTRGVAFEPEARAQLQNLATLPFIHKWICLLYTSPSPRDATLSRMPSSA